MKRYSIPLEDGEVLGTLNIGAQRVVSQERHDLWEKFNKLYLKFNGKQSITDIEMGYIFYYAYVCGQVDETTGSLNEGYMDENEFLFKLSDDRVATAAVFQKMFGIKEKKQDSQMHSGARRGKPHLV